MHESKGQHIGKAPSLHLFHTAVWWVIFAGTNTPQYAFPPIPTMSYQLSWDEQEMGTAISCKKDSQGGCSYSYSG